MFGKGTFEDRRHGRQKSKKAVTAVLEEPIGGSGKLESFGQTRERKTLGFIGHRDTITFTSSEVSK